MLNIKHTTHIPRHYIQYFFILFLTFGCYSNIAQASLMIKPTRVVMDERNRSAEVTLLNNSSTTKTYRILWEQKSQKENGAYGKLEDYEYSASNFIRHSPRKVTIKPGEYQKIKLRVKMPRELADGEYRSHLLMKVTEDNVDFSKYIGDEEVKGTSAIIIPRLSFSIPVLVRKGKIDTKADITSITVTKNNEGNNIVKVDLAHGGNFSSFGSLAAYMKTPSGNVVPIGEANNIALFRGTSKRTVDIPLQVPSIPKGAVVQVLYKGDDEFDGQILGKAAIRH